MKRRRQMKSIIDEIDGTSEFLTYFWTVHMINSLENRLNGLGGVRVSCVLIIHKWCDTIDVDGILLVFTFFPLSPVNEHTIIARFIHLSPCVAVLSRIVCVWGVDRWCHWSALYHFFRLLAVSLLFAIVFCLCSLCL